MLPVPLGDTTASATTRKANQPRPSARAMSRYGSEYSLSMPAQPLASCSVGMAPRNDSCSST
ncbi:hypothetical protein D3C81_1091770 [compost metagenome]